MYGTFRFLKWLFLLASLSACALDSTLPFTAARDNIPPDSPNVSCSDEPNHPDFQTGSGTSSSPYLICTPEQLLKLSQDSLYWQSHFELGSNIDLTDKVWESVGFYDDNDSTTRIPFTGSFDGKNYKVANLKVENTSASTSTGMFAHTDGARLENLVLEAVEIRGHRKVGFIGTAFNTNIENLSISGSILPPQGETASSFSGCLFGFYQGANQTTLKVKNINLDCDVYGHDLVATVFGRLNILDGSSFELSNILSEGNMIQTEAGNTNAGIGGFIHVTQNNNNLTLSNIEFTGDVTMDQGSGSWSGLSFGQLSFNGNSSDILLSNIKSTGHLSSRANFNVDGFLGGLVGNFNVSMEDSSIQLERIGIQSNITVLTNAEPRNNVIGGLIARLNFKNVNNLDFGITQSYSRGQFETLNNNILDRVGGFIGEIDLVGSAATLSFDVSSCYSSVDLILSGGTSLTNSLGFVAVDDVVPTYTDNYFYSSANLLGPGNSGESTDSANVTYLDSTDILQSSQFVGTGWDFSNIWQANDGMTAPNLR